MSLFRKFKKNKYKKFELVVPNGEIHHISKEENIEYYYDRAKKNLCQCNTCKVYYKEVKERFPELAKYLSDLGVDISLPFEAPSIGLMEEKGYEEYFAWYVVFGKCDIDYARKLGDLTMFATTSHPTTNIEEEHFVLEVINILFK